MRVHYFQHVAFEGPGYIATWIQEQGHDLSATHFFEPGYQLPDPSSIDVLVVMGGPMSVYDNALYPWLQEEKAFIGTMLQTGKKVLGICLGAQLAALALGAPVTRAAHKEIGWYPVFSATAVQQAAPHLYELLRQGPMVFHWHGDQFAIPEGAHELAFSAANRNQGFLYRDQVLGLQFHAEPYPADLALMLEHGRAELQDAPYIQDETTITQEMERTGQAHTLMADLLQCFFAGSL